MFDKLYQADWKPESAEKFGDISELGKSLGLLNVVDAKSAASRKGPKPTQVSSKAPSANPQKPAAYRPPSAKSAASVKAERREQECLEKQEKREKQKEKKGCEETSASSGS